MGKTLLFCFKSQGVSLEISLTTSCHLLIMFNFVGTIILDTFRAIYMICKSCITLFPAIIILQNTRIYVCALDCCNMTVDVEIPINKILGIRTTLSIPYINPDHYYVRFERSFDNSRAGGKNNIIKDVSGL